MPDVERTGTYAVQVEHLPVWWRCLLVAVATLILCSCSSPAMRTQLAGDNSLLQPAPAAAPPGPACTCDGGRAGYNADGAVPTDPYGPLVGPSDEYLCDGGDFGT